MKKLLVLCGPTATGKTALARQIAAQFDGELISADSQQLYKGLDILTGKDIPKGSTHHASQCVTEFEGTVYRHGYYAIENSRLWMASDVAIREQCSVAMYARFAQTIIQDIYARNKLPIVVGGTGLYINSILKPFETMSIPPQAAVREKYSSLQLREVQNALRSLDEKKFSSMNHSDQYNPRRLVRAIEVAQWSKSHSREDQRASEYDSWCVGLTAPLDILKDRIYQRICTRWQNGVVQEVKAYMSRAGYAPMLGLKQVISYIDNQCTKEEAIDAWFTVELNYAKRQGTWFKKQNNIQWFDIENTTYAQDVLRAASSWYTREV